MRDREPSLPAANPDSRIRVVVVDDEKLAREGLRDLLAGHSDIDVVATCASGQAAVKSIVDLAPDIVFLDVQMPGMSGFDVIRTVGPDAMPFVIFTTAFDRYALDAFESHALEYLLKPYSDERFAEAVGRGKTAVRERRFAQLGERIAALLHDVGAGAKQDSGPNPVERITVRSAGRTYFVAVTDIDWIEGADYYASLHSAGRHHLVRETLASLAARLDPRMFLRVHRSAIVNVNRVKEIRTSPSRESLAILADGTRIRLARGAKAKLEAILDPRL
jgi:two-component system LytT family response regulator